MEYARVHGVSRLVVGVAGLVLAARIAARPGAAPIGAVLLVGSGLLLATSVRYALTARSLPAIYDSRLVAAASALSAGCCALGTVLVVL